jgi:hypothetical protein
MQDGSVTVERRKRGPDVWSFRWREGVPDGRKIHRRIVLGTADDLKSIASARNAVVGLRREINLNDVRIKRESIKLADLSRHFQQRELADRNPRIAYSTKKAYAGYLEKWIEPRWGEYSLLEIRAVEVESWLKSLNRAAGQQQVFTAFYGDASRDELRCHREFVPSGRHAARAAVRTIATGDLHERSDHLSRDHDNGGRGEQRAVLNRPRARERVGDRKPEFCWHRWIKRRAKQRI